MCAALVAVSDLTSVRKALRSLPAAGQRRIHFATESDQRRRLILSRMAKLNISTTVYVATGSSDVASRAAILEAMVPRLQENGVKRLILDSRDSQDKQDRSTIFNVMKLQTNNELSYGHQPSHTDPLLWIPDAVAWAWGRGGDWKRRVEQSGLVTDVELIKVQ